MDEDHDQDAGAERGPLLPLSSELPSASSAREHDGPHARNSRRIRVAGQEVCAYSPAPDGPSAAASAASAASVLAAELRAPAAFVLVKVAAPALLFVGALLVNVSGSGVDLSAELVNKQSCQCECFDTKFKGAHRGNVQGYKYVYFNLERGTLWILLWFFLYMQILASGLAGAWRLLTAGALRVVPFLVLALTFFSHFYGAWCVFNYMNESGTGTQTLLPSQLFFSLTELLSSYCLFPFADARRAPAGSPVPPHRSHHGAPHVPRIAVPLIISTAHIAIALTERVLWGLFGLAGSVLVRDVFLVAADVATIAYCADQLRRAPPRAAHLSLGPLRASPLGYVPSLAAGLFLVYKATCSFTLAV